MNSVEVKSFANADEINDNFNNAKIEAVNVGGPVSYTHLRAHET